MVKPWGPLLLAGWLAAGCQPGAPVRDVPADQPAPEDLDSALQELEAAGVPPTREEVVTFLQEAGPPSAGTAQGSGLISGLVRLRLDGHVQGRFDQSGRLDLRVGPTRIAVRSRRYRDGVRVSGAGVRVETRFFTMAAGRVGLQNGWGLLAASPGRGPSLAADAGLGSRGSRISTWVGVPDARTLDGVGVSQSVGRWTIGGAAGRPVDQDEEASARLAAVSVGRTWDTASTRLFGLRIGPETGVSLWGDVRGPFLSGEAEAVVWQPDPGTDPRLAALVNVGWRPNRQIRLEGLAGVTDFAVQPRLAARPPLFKTWDGSGVGVRGMYRDGSGTVFRGLYALSRSRDRRWSLQDIRHSLVDLQISREVGTGIRLAVRLRETGETAHGWSERYPWVPPDIVAHQEQRVVSATLTREHQAFRYSILLRALQSRTQERARTRRLLSVTGWRRWSGGLRLRGTVAGAWGGDADLVAAVVPLTGLVLPRHWGSWRTEILAGVEYFRAGWRLQTAVSIREAEAWRTTGAPLAIWMDVQRRW